MNAAERRFFAEKGADLVCAQLRDGAVGQQFREAVQAKFDLLLVAVDDAVLRAGRPVVFDDVIPGFVVVAMRAPQARKPASEAQPVDVRAISSIDETSLMLLAHGLRGLLRSDFGAEGQVPEGAYPVEAEDGTAYFFFYRERREAVLESLGILPEAMISGRDVLSGGV